MLADFWAPFDQTVQAAMGVPVTDVIDELDAVLEPMLFPAPQVQRMSGKTQVLKSNQVHQHTGVAA